MFLAMNAKGHWFKVKCKASRKEKYIGTEMGGLLLPQKNVSDMIK